jgi:predicted nucleotidyltransferase
VTLRADPALHPEALEVAQSLVPRLAAEGAEAVVLTGSHARGTAHRHSDVDVVPLGVGPSRTLIRRSGLLVAISWRTPARIRERLADPGEVGTAVPTAREALILYDPLGIATSIQRDAFAWTWERVEEHCDRWVAEETTRLAEEAQKLIGALENGWSYPAAMQRSIVSLAVGPVLAVHFRLLYGREARLFELLSDLMGERWERPQARSLGLGGESLRDSCEAALELYALTVAEVSHLLDARQRRVVAHVCSLVAGAA